MAFNLNKNDEAKKGSSGFDLSKQAVPAAKPANTVPLTTQSSHSKNWVTGLVALVIVGAGVWYYSSSKEATSIKPNPSSGSAAITPANAEVTDSITNPSQRITTPAKNKAEVSQNESSAKTATIAALNRKIPVSFARGSSAFMSIDEAVIKRLVAYLKDNPEAFIQVNGYASSDGSLEINQIISQARADAFKQFLISKSIAAERINAIGKGIENPIASNETNLGRKKNRRIEVTFP